MTDLAAAWTGWLEGQMFFTGLWIISGRLAGTASRDAILPYPGLFSEKTAGQNAM